MEIFLPPSDDHVPLIQPIIRWDEYDTILTPINPKISRWVYQQSIVDEFHDGVVIEIWD